MKRLRMDYHPEQLTDSNRRMPDGRSIEVESKMRVLYDDKEQPVRRQIGFVVSRGTR